MIPQWCTYIFSTSISFSDEMLQIEKNDEKMWEYLNIAIDENDGEALYIVGDMYFNGSDGKEIDYRCIGILFKVWIRRRFSCTLLCWKYVL